VDTSWIPVFVLILNECAAPAGKTVCQEQDLRLQFVEQAECELALRQFIELKALAENIIVNRDASRCEKSARSIESFDSFEELSAKYVGARSLGTSPDKQTTDFTVDAHRKRLAELQSCDETSGVAPCKVGEIIIEAAPGENLDVWRREP